MTIFAARGKRLKLVMKKNIYSKNLFCEFHTAIEGQFSKNISLHYLSITMEPVLMHFLIA